MEFWLADIESLEAICQDDETRRIVLRLAQISRGGGLLPLLDELAGSDHLDDATRENVAELAREPAFLFAVEDYVRRTQRLH